MLTLLKTPLALARTPVVRASVAYMHENPYTARFKVKPSPGFEKQTTGLTALNVLENPHYELDSVYGRILDVLKDIPAESVYRQNTEAVVKQRLALVKQGSDIKSLEQKIGMGQIEEVLEQAQYELRTAHDMLKYRVWEPLADEPPAKQWTWPL